MDLSEIKDFEGKRNCCLTFFIPPKIDFRKNLLKVEKKINSLKHENKRKQLRLVMKTINSKLNNISSFETTGTIICAGLNNMMEVKYYQIVPKKIIEDFEYFFDYNFHYNKILEKCNLNFSYATIQQQKNIISKLPNLRDSNKIIYAKELYNLNDYKNIKTIYYFSEEIIPDYLVNIRKPIIMLQTNYKTTHLIKEYSKTIGVLFY